MIVTSLLLLETNIELASLHQLCLSNVLCTISIRDNSIPISRGP